MLGGERRRYKLIEPHPLVRGAHHKLI
jgi:hypothetical protein